MKIIIVDGIAIYFERSRRRTIAIQIFPPNIEVHCKAPMTCSWEQITNFIQSKKEWIIKTQNKMLENPEKYKRNNIDVKSISRSEQQELYKKLEFYVKKWEEQTGLRVNSFTIKRLKSSWGICACKYAKISFSIKLARMPDEFISYIVLHEICHIKHPNHSKDFHNMVSTYMPNWKIVNKKSIPVNNS